MKENFVKDGDILRIGTTIHAYEEDEEINSDQILKDLEHGYKLAKEYFLSRLIKMLLLVTPFCLLLIALVYLVNSNEHFTPEPIYNISTLLLVSSGWGIPIYIYFNSITEEKRIYLNIKSNTKNKPK